MSPISTILCNKLQAAGISFTAGVSLKGYSWFKSGGEVDLIISPTTVNQLVATVHLLHQTRLPYKVIGETSNLLFLDDEHYTCLLSTKAITGMHTDKETGMLVAEAGSLLPDLSRYALYDSIVGFAGLEGIPGTIGGAVFMNAGAFNYSIDQVLDRVEVVNPDGSLETLSASALKLTHRDSIFKQGGHPGIILRAFFQAHKGDQHEIHSQMELFHSKRHKYLEYMYPNLGSLFVGSVYRALGERDLFYKLVSACYMGLNYRFKPFRRESPINRKWLNDFTVKRFNIKFRQQPFSDKTINSLINNGHHTSEHLEYIRQIREIVGDRLIIENEVVAPF